MALYRLRVAVDDYQRYFSRGATVFVALVALVALAACRDRGTVSQATSIYLNGQVVTVEDSRGTVQAIAVADGRILALGSDRQIQKYRGDNTRVVDLKGKTLLPGFVDAHSHLSAVAIQAVAANLMAAPDGPVVDIATLQSVLRDYLADSTLVKDHGLVLGVNYDDSQLVERRHPTREELDAISIEIPVIAVHQSWHLGVYNSKALAMLGITSRSPNPTGGVIERRADGVTPSGVLQETAHFSALFGLLPEFSSAQYLASFKAGEALYTANGFTTIQDGRTDPATLQRLAALATAQAFDVDVVAYPDLTMVDDNSLIYGPLHARSYADNFRIGGIKLSFDGSPQGKTAWFGQPYHQPPANQDDGYVGYGAFSDAEAHEWLTLAYRNNWQVLAHANGDAAIDQLLASVKVARRLHPGDDRRTVLIHGQYLRKDQVEQLHGLDIFPALYPMHTFYWGDWHRDSVAGPTRAANISPTGWLVARDMKFSIHSDAPVTFPNSM
ncbi:MAG: amidohydrolase, partial [Porticoccaceae bacterium]|nr:amidohydrolase [Porticoccaceae bacterium]